MTVPNLVIMLVLVCITNTEPQTLGTMNVAAFLQEFHHGNNLKGWLWLVGEAVVHKPQSQWFDSQFWSSRQSQEVHLVFDLTLELVRHSLC